MAKVNIIRFKGKKLKDDSHPIIIQITHDRKAKRISLGYSASNKEWNENQKKFTRHKANYVWLNHYIEKRRNDIEEIVLKLESDSDDLTMAEISFAMKNELEKKTFFIFTQEVIDDLKKANKLGNAAIY